MKIVMSHIIFIKHHIQIEKLPRTATDNKILESYFKISKIENQESIDTKKSTILSDSIKNLIQ